MNPYAMLAFGSGASTSSALAARLAAWHDAMVAHERRLRTGRTGDVCDDECPHMEARTLWVEALAAFGERAHDLTFLRSRAAIDILPAAETVAVLRTGPEGSDNGSPERERRRTIRDRPFIISSLRRQHMTTEAEL